MSSSSDASTCIRAHDFRKLEQNGSVRICCRLDTDLFPEELWFDIKSDEVGPLAVEEPNWAAIALILPAMMSGCDLVIEADISPRLLHALNGDLQGLLLAYDSRLKRVKVEAGAAPLPASIGNGVAAGFSAGIDSFATLLAYSDAKTPKPLRLTHLTVHNVGALGNTPRTSLDRSDAYDKACARTTSAANDYGLGTMFVSSNMEDVFDSCRPSLRSFEHSHSIRNAVCAHIFHDYLGYFLYSSAVPYCEIGLSTIKRGAKRGMATIDPILLPLLSTERLTILSAGAEMSRGEKSALVAKSELARDMLDVCSPTRRRVKGDLTYNCSRCKKCVRTIATLEAIGQLEDFDRVFQVDLYKATRTSLLRGLHESARAGDNFDREVIALLREAGLSVPEPRPKVVIKLNQKFSHARKRLQKLKHTSRSKLGLTVSPRA